MSMVFRAVFATVLLSAAALHAPAHAAGHARITGTYDNPAVPVYGLDYAKLGQMPAEKLIGNDIVGEDASTGMLKVQTERGPVLVRPAAVQTDMTAAAPDETRCVRIASGSADQSSSSSNNLGTGCHGS